MADIARGAFPRALLDEEVLLREQADKGFPRVEPSPREEYPPKVARTAGLRLETTYTGKCLASLRQRAERGVAFDGPVLFRNTHNDVDLAALAPRSPASCALPPVFHRRLDQGR